MRTEYSVFRVDGSETRHEIDWPEQPGFKVIQALVEPLLGDREPMEHATVLHDGQPADMFVSEVGHVELTTRPPLPINDAATKIYRHNWLTQHPDADPDDLPAIAGTAVLFHRRVWF